MEYSNCFYCVQFIEVEHDKNEWEGKCNKLGIKRNKITTACNRFERRKLNSQ